MNRAANVPQFIRYPVKHSSLILHETASTRPALQSIAEPHGGTVLVYGLSTHSRPYTPDRSGLDLWRIARVTTEQKGQR